MADEKEISTALKKICDSFTSLLVAKRIAGHVRARIFRPTRGNKIRAVQSSEKATDDRLLLRQKSRGIGEAFSKGHIKYLDLNDVIKSHEEEFDRYAIALLNVTQRYVIAIPVFRQYNHWNRGGSHEPLAVLVLDCDEDFVGLYNDLNLRAKWIEMSKLITDCFWPRSPRNAQADVLGPAS